MMNLTQAGMPAAAAGHIAEVDICTGQRLILDTSYPKDDARCLVAWLEESPRGVDVIWLRPTGLPTFFENHDCLYAALERRGIGGRVEHDAEPDERSRRTEPCGQY
jgi:hypothetical protein